MNSRRKPTHINFCNSIQAFHAGVIERVPIQEAEARIAAWRDIPSFNWIEDFSDEEIPDFDNQNYADSLINPDDLALCYFGDDVGYAPIAINRIKRNKCLVFAGDIVPCLHPDDIHPYRVGSIIAKCKGGFASMFMDLPSDADVVSLNKRLEKLNLGSVLLQAKNIRLMDYQVKNGVTIYIFHAMRDIQPGSIIGSSYSRRTRLLYNEFVAFDAQGRRLPSELNMVLSEILYKQIIKAELSKENFRIYKTINQIQNKKYKKALQTILACPWVLQELTDKEVTFLKNKVTGAGTTLLRQEHRLRYPGKYSYLKRRLVLHIQKMINLELDYKNKSPICLRPSDNHFVVVYPGSENDMLHLWDLMNKLRFSEQSKQYAYNTAVFFARKNQNAVLLASLAPPEESTDLVP